VHHFSSKIHQEKFAQERDTKISQDGANFRQYVFSQWDSYDENEIDIIYIYTNPVNHSLSTFKG
jgi:hypothetical protein